MPEPYPWDERDLRSSRAMRPAAALRFWEERHARLDPLAAVGYATVGEPFNRWMYRVRRNVFLGIVPALLGARRDISVLDVGSGTGFYAELWRELGVVDVTASDAAATAVARLRDRLGDARVLGLDIAGAPDALPDRRFDAVSAFDVLFHLVDDAAYERAFANLGELVRPGGLLLFSENFRPDATHRVSSTQVDRAASWTLRLLDGAGFDVIERRPMFVLMNDPQNTGSPLLRAWWRALSRVLRAWPAAGAAVGPPLHLVERALVRRDGPGPSTDLMACRRR